jgi:hypothetical protein
MFWIRKNGAVQKIRNAAPKSGRILSDGLCCGNGQPGFLIRILHFVRSDLADIAVFLKFFQKLLDII